ALAYAPNANSPADRTKLVGTGAPASRRSQGADTSPQSGPGTVIDTVGAKLPERPDGRVVMTSTRLAASRNDDVWMRMMVLAPSATNSMHATILGDPDITPIRAQFVKPPSAIAITFSNDPQMGIVTDRFTGVATVKLPVQAFQTAPTR